MNDEIKEILDYFQKDVDKFWKAKVSNSEKWKNNSKYNR